MNGTDRERYAIRVKNGRELRCGYTTGSCATAAAAAAAQMLLSGKRVYTVSIEQPSGQCASFDIENAEIHEDWASCSVTKDAGDDPDVTNGLAIYAMVRYGANKEITLTAGVGIGVVTGAGLPCAPGEPAINPVPRKMILHNVRTVCEQQSYRGGLLVEISAPGGEEIAKQTFNPRLGIIGGISILGTTGIVEPMSEQALVKTIQICVRKAKSKDSARILLSPGNYGRDYCLRQLGVDLENGIKFSNFLGETLDYVVYEGFTEALLVGHIGKLVKVAGGIMNTHSSVADCRMEILAVHAALAGADRSTVAAIMDCKTTDAAIQILEETGLHEEVYASLLAKIQYHIAYRTKGRCRVELIIFSTEDKLIVRTEGALALAECFKEREGEQHE